LIDIAAGIAQAVRGLDIFYRAAIAIQEARPDAGFLVIGDKAVKLSGDHYRSRPRAKRSGAAPAGSYAALSASRVD